MTVGDAAAGEALTGRGPTRSTDATADGASSGPGPPPPPCSREPSLGQPSADGLLQLGRTLGQEQKPAEVEGIKVGRTFAKLHLLHATCRPDGCTRSFSLPRFDTLNRRAVLGPLLPHRYNGRK